VPKRKYLKRAGDAPPPEDGAAEEHALPAPREPETHCALCGRPLAGPCNRHHLIPLSRGGKGTTTLLLHKICHDKIHAVFTETELLRHYNTIERLQEHEEMAAFVRWVQKKEPEFYDRSAKTTERQAGLAQKGRR